MNCIRVGGLANLVQSLLSGEMGQGSLDLEDVWIKGINTT